MPLRPNSPRVEKIAARRAVKASGVTGLAIPPHGAAALLNTPGAGAARRRRVTLRAFDESKVSRDETGKFGSGSGGGGDKPKKPAKQPKQTPEERAAAREQERQQNVDKSFAASGLSEDSFYSLIDFASGKADAPDGEKELLDAGLIEQARDGTYRMTPAGRQLARAAERGDTRDVKDTISKARDQKAERAERQAAREAKRAEREARRADKKPKPGADDKPSATPAPATPAKPSGGGGGRRAPEMPVGGRTLFDGTSIQPATKAMRPARRKLWRGAYAEAKAAGLPTPDARRAASRALRQQDVGRAERGYQRAVGRLAVFKDAQGRERWAAVSSTAYRDRDGEIVSTEALRGAVALADATGGARGPLRFWHVPGLDLGDCDYQAVAAGGRVLIESGTFRRPAYARAVKAVADGYQMSIGFTHPASEPDPAGVFRTIQIFERSLVPAGRASNPFTRITTKDRAMDIAPDKLTALKALLGEQGAQEFLRGAQQTDKAAQAAGVAFKEAAAPAVYTLPDGTPGVIVGGQFVALKAAAEKAPMPPAQMMQAAMTEAADAAAEMDPAADEASAEAESAAAAVTDDTDVMDLTVGDLRAVLGGIVEGMIAGYNTKMAEMKAQYEAMGKAFGAMQQQKDDSAARQADEIARLKTEQDAIAARLKELEGDAAPAARRAQGAAEPASVAEPPAGIATKAAALDNPAAGAYAMIYGEAPAYPIQ